MRYLQLPEDTAIIAVFDGHGGPFVSRNLAQKLERVYFTVLAGVCDESVALHNALQRIPGSSKDGIDTTKKRAELMSCVLKRVVAQLEIQTAINIHSTVVAASKPLANSCHGWVGGSTATIITITKCKRHDIGGKEKEVLQLVGAAVGDSRAVLSRDGVAEPLTQDHRLEVNREERERVLKAGGEIKNGRMWGDLQTSRSIGDLPYKKRAIKMIEDLLSHVSPTREGPLDPATSLRMVQETLWTEDNALTSCPDLFSLHLDLNDDNGSAEFIVLASDGLWDYVGSQEAVNFVRSHLLESQDLHEAALGLVDLSLRRAMRGSDNVSVVILAFNQIDSDCERH